MKNLLIITSRYIHQYDKKSNIFVSSRVEELKKYFKRVVVISTTPYTPKMYKKWRESKRRSDALAKNYKYANIEVYFTKNIIVPLKTIKIFRGLQGFFSSMKILKVIKFKPDIVHAHFLWPSGYLAMKLKENYKFPYIVTGHGYDVYDIPFRNKFYFKTVRKILYKADHIITVSDNTKEVMIKKLKVPIQKIAVISNGYDQKLFRSLNQNHIRKKLSLPLDKKILLSIGNLKPVKGHIYLIKAAKHIVNKRKNILFVVVGEGPERNNLENEIRKNNLKDNFILVGGKPHNEIPLWINACDIFVIPSLNEAGPVVLFEAMACGKPVVGTNVGFISGTLDDNKLGKIIPPGDAKALSQGLLSTLKSQWDKKYIQDYVKSFTWENVAKKELLIYRKVLK